MNTANRGLLTHLVRKRLGMDEEGGGKQKNLLHITRYANLRLKYYVATK
jgi:hypothetical protein